MIASNLTKRGGMMEASRCTHEFWMEGRRGTASMSRGHQTGQARIATTPGPVGDLQRVTRRELNGAGSNEVGVAHRCPVYVPRQRNYASETSPSEPFRLFPPILEPPPRRIFVCTQCENPWPNGTTSVCGRWPQTSFPIELTSNARRFQGARTGLQPLENGATL